MPCRNVARRNFTDQSPDVGDAVEKVSVPSGVKTVHPISEDGDGVAACRESGLVRSSFDPVSAARNDHPLISGGIGSEFACLVVPVRSRRSRPRDRHKVAQRTSQERRRTTHPEHIRRAVAKIIDGRWPMRISGNQRTDSRLLNLTEPLGDVLRGGRIELIAPDPSVNAGEARHVVVTLSNPQHLHRPDLSQEPTGHRIVGLYEHGQHHPCRALVACDTTQSSHQRVLSALDANEVCAALQRARARYGGETQVVAVPGPSADSLTGLSWRSPRGDWHAPV